MRRQTILLLFLTLLPCALFAQSDSIGIFMQNGDIISRIEPIKSKGHKANALGSFLTMGVANTSLKVLFNGMVSENKASKNSIFYFYYDPTIINDSELLMIHYMFAAGSPKTDFSLVKFTQKKGNRELITAKVNTYSGIKKETDAGSAATLTVEKVRTNKYKVTLNNIEPGEYCFMYNGADGSGAYMPVFDFSIE